ncbi:hypothetical protein C9J85_15940 [Haloferax sp. wsp5]|nr:hypothetical protein C9J85_15940 [Haloferax sp. wsp5]
MPERPPTRGAEEAGAIRAKRDAGGRAGRTTREQREPERSEATRTGTATDGSREDVRGVRIERSSCRNGDRLSSADEPARQPRAVR